MMIPHSAMLEAKAKRGKSPLVTTVTATLMHLYRYLSCRVMRRLSAVHWQCCLATYRGSALVQHDESDRLASGAAAVCVVTPTWVRGRECEGACSLKRVKAMSIAIVQPNQAGRLAAGG